MSDAEVPLPNDLALCHELIRQQAATLQEARRRIEQLEHSVEQLLRRQYGPRSERVDPSQLHLYEDEAEETPPPPTLEDLPRTEEKAARTWRRRGRQRLPEHLPRERIVLELTDPERACPGCGQLRMPFGEEVSEQLEYVPASLFVKEQARYLHCQELLTLRRRASRGMKIRIAAPFGSAQQIEVPLRASPGMINGGAPSAW
jgi:hypothetical protein